ncbi:olfactory receptor 1f45-like [Pholidichthys leucotaenia]
MELFNSALGRNITFVRPAYFIVRAFVGIPNVKYYFIFLCVVFFISLVGNIIVMSAIILDHTLRTPKYMAIFNLALTDLLTSSTLVPNVIDMFLFNHTSISYNGCMAYLFFSFTFISVQFMNLVILSFDRLMAIVYPLHYHVKVTNKLMLSLIVFFWLFIIVLVLIAVGFLTRLSICGSVVIKSYFCDHGPIFHLACNDVTPSLVISLLFPVVILGLPLVFIVVSYCWIAYALAKISTLRESIKAFKTCSSHLLLVALNFLPTIFVYSYVGKIHPNARVINLSLTNIIPPMLDPIIYVLQTQEIRDSLKKFLRSRWMGKIATVN